MKMTKIVSLSIGILAATTTLAFADPIEGNWRTQSGETAKIGKCGGAYCITVQTGQHAGKRIGRMERTGAEYKGTITDPADNRTYRGSASVSGSSMKLTGCALRVFCRTQNWRKL